MSLQKEMLREIARVVNEHEPYRIDEWFTEDFKLVEPTKPDWPRGHAGDGNTDATQRMRGDRAW
jgi:hypothetical protein